MKLLALTALLLATVLPARATTPDQPTPAVKAEYVAKLRALPGQIAKMRLYRVEPDYVGRKWGTIEGFKVVTSTPVREARNQAVLLNALASGIAAAGKTLPGCFSPHNAIRVWQTDGKVVNIIICYSCGAIHIHGWSDGIIALPLSNHRMDLFDKVVRSVPPYYNAR